MDDWRRSAVAEDAPKNQAEIEKPRDRPISPAT